MKAEIFAKYVMRFRWPIVILFPVVAFLMLKMAIPNFGFEGNVRIWFAEDSPILKDYEEFKANFGTDETVIIAFKDENGIFNQKALESIDRLTEKLWQTRYIGRVDSITNYQYVHSDVENPDDIIVDDFIEDVKALTPAELETKKQIATTDIQVKNRLISEDGKTAIITARMIPRDKGGQEAYFELRTAVEEMLADESHRSGYEFKATGLPHITTAFIDIAKSDMARFTPLVFATAFVLLIILFRTATGGIAPFLVVLLTVVFVLAFMGIIGYKFNNFTANLPVFITAIGIADAVHLYWIWLLGRRGGKSNEEAIVLSMQKNLFPAFLTSLTTFIGFISLAPSEVIPVKTLGISTAAAAIVAFWLSVMFLPALLAIINPRIKKKESEIIDEYHIPNWARRYSTFVLSNDKGIVIFSMSILLFCAIGLSFVKIDSQGIRYFKPETEVRQTVKFIQENITGPLSFEVLVDSGESAGIKGPEFQRTVQRFGNELQAEFPEVRHIFSLLDVIKRFHRVMHGENPEYYAIPDDKNLIAQYLFLYSLSLPQGMEINDRMDVDEKLFRITVSVNNQTSSANMKILNWIRDWWEQTPYRASVSGQNSMYTYMQENVTRTLITSISLALTLVVITMFIAFRSLTVVGVSILTNVMPVILVVGVMGWLGIDIGLGVAVSAAIILGVAVDDTIHFLVKYRYARGRGKSIRDSLEYMISYAGMAIVFTTVVLSLAFSLFLASEFAPNFNFGIVTATALLLAMLIDLLMLPAMLSLLEKRREK